MAPGNYKITKLLINEHILTRVADCNMSHCFITIRLPT